MSVLDSVPDGLLAPTTLEELLLDGALGQVRQLPDLSALPRLRVLRMSGQVGYAGRPPGHDLLGRVWQVATLEDLRIDRWGEQTEYKRPTHDRVTGGHEVARPALTALPDDAFARMGGLRRLDLSFNELASLPESFYQLSSLEFADLQYTKLDAPTLTRLQEVFPRVRLDLRKGIAPADDTDPGWQAVHTLVQQGAERLSGSPEAAVSCFEQALARCQPGARFSEYDQLYALYGLINALRDLAAEAEDEDEGQELTGKLIGYAEQALAVAGNRGTVWHFTNEGAFQEEVTRLAGNSLAWHLLQRGEHQRALSAAERALAVAGGPEHDYIRDTMARILLAVGRDHDAYLIADIVLTRNPGCAHFADLAASPQFRAWREANSAAEAPPA
jgi:hypothetical protein